MDKEKLYQYLTEKTGLVASPQNFIIILDYIFDHISDFQNMTVVDNYFNQKIIDSEKAELARLEAELPTIQAKIDELKLKYP